MASSKVRLRNSSHQAHKTQDVDIPESDVSAVGRRSFFSQCSPVYSNTLLLSSRYYQSYYSSSSCSQSSTSTAIGSTYPRSLTPTKPSVVNLTRDQPLQAVIPRRAPQARTRETEIVRRKTLALLLKFVFRSTSAFALSASQWRRCGWWLWWLWCWASVLNQRKVSSWPTSFGSQKQQQLVQLRRSGGFLEPSTSRCTARQLTSPVFSDVVVAGQRDRKNCNDRLDDNMWLMVRRRLILTHYTTRFSSVATIIPSKYYSGSSKLVIASTSSSSGGSLEDQMGFNELHTRLRDAVQTEDYTTAGKMSNVMLGRLFSYGDDDNEGGDVEKNISSNKGETWWRQRRSIMSWRGLGAAPWLIDRLNTFNFTFPTTIQINAMRAVNAILDRNTKMEQQRKQQQSLSSVSDGPTMPLLGDRVDQQNPLNDMGIVISGTTGSGKTLAYQVPLLSILSDSLFKRQRIRIGAEEAVVGDTTDNLLDRLAIVTSPTIRSSNNRNQQAVRPNGAIATGAALLSTLGTSGTDVQSPLALIVVPTRELGVQSALLLYELIGGNSRPNNSIIPLSLKYKGPKGIRIACVLDEEEAALGLKLQTDVAITTPKYLSKLLSDGDIDPSKLRVIVYDEADLALEQTSSTDLVCLFDDDRSKRQYTRLTFLVGATVTESFGKLAVSSRVLPPGRSWIATATRCRALQVNETTSNRLMDAQIAPKIIGGNALLQDLDVCLYPGLKHERVIVDGKNVGLLVLTRLLRKELQEYEKKINANPDTQFIQRPRVVVFFPDEMQARAAIEPLRDALWGEHRLCVLLPQTGVNPLTIMDQFKQNQTTVMLATPNSVRGLDFPLLTHVYTLYLPNEDPREYVHLAGRVGRIGQLGTVVGDGGHVVSILPKEEANKLEQLASSLQFQFYDIDTSALSTTGSLSPDEWRTDVSIEETKVEQMRRYLEDAMSLLELTDETSIRDIDMSESARDDIEEDENDDDDDDDDSDFV